MLQLLGNLWSQRQLVRGFVVRDLKSRYVGSSMGFFWSVVVPFLYLFVFMFVFSLVLKSRWTDAATPPETALYMLVGILAWQAFAETLSRATNCLVDNANLIQKVVFPSEILPAFLTISSLVNMLIGLPIVIVAVALIIGRSPGASYLSLPLLIVLQAMFTVGLGFFLSTLNLFVRDTYHLIGVLILVWMFATPIFYPAILVQRAHVPLPGTDVTLERWIPTEGPRVRVAADSSATFEVGPLDDPDPRWRAEVPDGLPPEARDFLAPRVQDAQPRSGMRAEEAPESLDGYVVLGSVLHRRMQVVERETISLGFILELNPIFWLIDSYRRVILLGIWPDPRYLLQFGGVALVALALGSRFFARHKHRFPDLL